MRLRLRLRLDTSLRATQTVSRFTKPAAKSDLDHDGAKLTQAGIVVTWHRADWDCGFVGTARDERGQDPDVYHRGHACVHGAGAARGSGEFGWRGLRGCDDPLCCVVWCWCAVLCCAVLCCLVCVCVCVYGCVRSEACAYARERMGEREGGGERSETRRSTHTLSLSLSHTQTQAHSATSCLARGVNSLPHHVLHAKAGTLMLLLKPDGTP
eukprot:2904922-Rhodomonas_salina.4